MTEAQARDLSYSSAQASSAPAYPGIAMPIGASNSQRDFNSAVKQILESGTGVRGTPFDKWMTLRDVDARLLALGLAVPGLNYARPKAGLPETGAAIPLIGPTGTSYLSLEAFGDKLKTIKLWSDLMKRIDDASRFDGLPEQTRAILKQDLAVEAQKLGAEIKRWDEKIQTATDSFAQTVSQVTASAQGNAAAIRQIDFASTSANVATAGRVTTITARLNNFNGGGATVEVYSAAVASRTTGLEARYTVKVTAGGAMAGFGLAAYDNTAGNAVSAFIIQADKFAIVSSSYAGGLDTTPDVTAIPFGVDSDGAYVGGNLKVTGKAYIDGVQTVDTYANALTVNNSLAQPVGGYFKTNTNLAGGGAAAIFFSSNGGAAIQAISQGGASGYAGVFSALSSGHIGVVASGLVGGSTALACNGLMTINNSTLVSNLNAQYLNSHADTYFATASHTHAGVYETVANVAKALIYQSTGTPGTPGVPAGYLIVKSTDATVGPSYLAYYT